MAKEKNVEINFMYVDHDYVETFGLEIVEGRDFSEKLPADAQSAYLVNEAAVDFMGIPDPVGKRAALAGRPGKIVGIIKNFNHKPLIFNISPLVLGIRPSWFYDLMIKIRHEDIPGSLAFIEKTFKEISPGFPFEYRFLDEQFEEIYYPLQIMNQILNGLAFLAVFISCLGLFGLASLLMEQKKREIGIRKVLGAPVSGVIYLLIKKFMGIIIIANVIAIPASLYISRKFLNFFVQRANLSWDIIVITVISTFIAALVTISYHVVRTTRTDPVNVIHHE